jgi:hypothetical protein
MTKLVGPILPIEQMDGAKTNRAPLSHIYYVIVKKDIVLYKHELNE